MSHVDIVKVMQQVPMSGWPERAKMSGLKQVDDPVLPFPTAKQEARIRRRTFGKRDVNYAATGMMMKQQNR